MWAASQFCLRTEFWKDSSSDSASSACVMQGAANECNVQANRRTDREAQAQAEAKTSRHRDGRASRNFASHHNTLPADGRTSGR